MYILGKINRKILFALLRLLQRVRILFYSSISSLKTNGRVICYQPLHALGAGKLNVGVDVKVGVFPSPFFFTSHGYMEARYPSAVIEIGDNTWINNGFVAIAEYTKISIGKRCLIGLNVEVLDSDFHGLEIEKRGISDPLLARPVFVENDVFIGNNVKIQKGVVIGCGAVIANGSIVTRNVPEKAVVGGNPAKIIKMID